MRGLQWVPVAVLVAGWAHAGMRHAPVAEPVVGVFVVAVVASLLVAYWCGRRSGRASAFAVASARAEARAAALARSESAASSTSAVVVNIGDGARHAAVNGYAGLDAAPWIGDRHALIEQDHMTQALEDGSSYEELMVSGALEASDGLPRTEGAAGG